MLKLQNQGCHNINLVTPTHFTPQIVAALSNAIEHGLEIPLVYNCGGYESVKTLQLLNGIIDIYMPDIKYSDNQMAKKYSKVTNYWDVVTYAVKEMHKQVGDLKISRRGIAQRGLLIRHLVLPKNIGGSEKVFEFIANEISRDSYINIMDQYYPAYHAYRYEEISQRITANEYSRILRYAEKLGLHHGFNE
jgi:putative pyruvate formate lyase activating enzyme